jgi:AmmeMemoRadiSam system protein B
VVLPRGAAVLAVLMDGRRTMAQLQAAFHERTGATAPRADVEALVRALDDAWLLEGERFRRRRREQLSAYLKGPVRPAWHAGRSYPSDAADLSREFDAFFVADGGPGVIGPATVRNGRPLAGIISPHIDPARGGSAYAWAYKAVAEESDADLFVVFGTAHQPMRQWFCASRKDFSTPLGTVRTDQAFIDRLAAHLASSVAGRCIKLFDDELAHRVEHSIEFQVTFLQHVLGGKREFRIVPILVGSFHEFLAENDPPDGSPEIQAFLAAMRFAARQHPGKVCYVSGADLAHVGRRFGDPWPMNKSRLAAQSKDDRKLLKFACQGDAAGFFRHVALQKDRSRICGLSPTYTMLAVLGPVRGKLHRYDQAVEADGSACVTFASAALYKRSARGK